MEKVVIAANDGARAEAFTHGAQVTSWKTASGEERLFLSERSAFAQGAAIRGGIPVIFPQFGALGPLPKHGFARVVEWERERAGRTSSGSGEARFRLTATPPTRAIWNHAFATSVVVTVQGMSLGVALSVVNEDKLPFRFTTALHTYLLVDDVRTTVVLGLQQTTFRDSAAGGPDLSRQQGALEVRDDVRRTRVSMAGFTDVVIWNPGAERGAALSDLEPDGWLSMLCVEAAVVGTPVELGPGERWTGQQVLNAL